jgi:hypothetical protein
VQGSPEVPVGGVQEPHDKDASEAPRHSDRFAALPG